MPPSQSTPPPSPPPGNSSGELLIDLKSLDPLSSSPRSDQPHIYALLAPPSLRHRPLPSSPPHLPLKNQLHRHLCPLLLQPRVRTAAALPSGSSPLALATTSPSPASFNRMVDCKDLQQSKALDKLADHVEDRPMAALGLSKEANMNAMRLSCWMVWFMKGTTELMLQHICMKLIIFT